MFQKLVQLERRSGISQNISRHLTATEDLFLAPGLYKSLRICDRSDSRMKRLVYGSFLLGAVSLLAVFALTTTGCGSSSTQMRFVHAGDNAGNVDFLIDSKTVSTNIPYANSTGYNKTSSGSRTIEVRPTGSSSDIVNTDVTLAGGSFSTGVLLNTNNNSQPTLSVYTDDHSAPPSGQAALRFIHAAANAQNVDIYIISPGQGITGLSPTISNIAFNSSAGPQNLSAGSYEVVFTVAGTQQIIIDTGSTQPITLTAGQVKTFIAIDNLGNAPFLILSDVD
jgi:hypothetical protein